MNRLKKYLFELSVIVAILISIAFSFVSVAIKEQSELSKKLIRLHIVANSNSDYDQSKKLFVRDKIIEYLSPKLSDAKSVKDAYDILQKNLSEIKNIAIKNSGLTARAILLNESFSTRKYESFSLPAGNYLALRVIIGKGEGKNWWCVAFPPICLSACEEELLKTAKDAGLSEDEIKLITDDTVKVKYKFKILEIIKKLFNN